MRAQTERKYRNLPEVLGKKAEKKKKEDFRTNRLMAEVFARVSMNSLQVLPGYINFLAGEGKCRALLMPQLG
jgi:hypothetical protein